MNDFKIKINCEFDDETKELKYKFSINLFGATLCSKRTYKSYSGAQLASKRFVDKLNKELRK